MLKGLLIAILNIVMIVLLGVFQSKIIIPVDAILFSRGWVLNTLIFVLTAGLSIYIVVILFKDIYYYYVSLIVALVLGITICMFNYTYFTETECIKSTFGFKTSVNLNTVESIVMYPSYSKGTQFFHYKVLFENGDKVHLDDRFQPYSSKDLYNLNLVLKEYNPKYTKKFRTRDYEDMTEYELSIVKNVEIQ